LGDGGAATVGGRSARTLRRRADSMSTGERQFHDLCTSQDRAGLNAPAPWAILQMPLAAARAGTKPRTFMSIHRRHTSRVLACALMFGQAGTAAAQSAQPTTPQQTTATYDDWIVRCETRQGPPAQKTCEMVQFTQLKGRAGVLTQIAIGRPVKARPVKIVIQVPIGVWLPTGVKLVPDGAGAALAATFKRCTPAACFADVDVKDDVIRKFKTAAKPGKLAFRDANQKEVSLPVSFKGFNAAFEALSKE
jgi:invasion protein IalB